MKAISFLLLMLIVAACSFDKKPIAYGQDQCANCQMTVSDRKWGAELVSDKSKIYVFDSIECLIYFIIHNPSVKYRHLWTVDYSSNGELTDANKAVYLRSKEFHSPMGFDVASFPDVSALKSYAGPGTKELTFNEVYQLVQKEWAK